MSLKAVYGSASYLRIGWLLANVVSTAIYRLTTYPFRKVRASTLGQDVRGAAVRCVMGCISIADARFLIGTTSDEYVKRYCKPQGLAPKTLHLDTENGRAVAHWIGEPDADTVILYCHGGAYVLPANQGNFQHLDGLVSYLNSARNNVSVLVLAYTLAPEATYPTQLREAAIVLAHLVHESGRSPSSIFLAGDSAGGNLALSLLSHILHPHPDVFALELKSPLGGALLLSPWVSFSTDYPSYKTHGPRDILNPAALRKWSAIFLDKADTSNPEADPGLASRGDAYTEACLNPASWWNSMDQVVSDVFVWSGGYEVFVDSIRELETTFKAGWAHGGGDISRVIFVESAEHQHVAPVFDTAVAGAKKDDAQVAIEEWFKGRLQR
ncbi:Alpha/Beta hydrolase protein [Boeremia exigua]|uniref:Alpha/Beta hydrolase protein n=1 Tax=Boeremia exigua TaxID=749465 RepID=UPI001E8CB4C7|nr:Alpha/Beta hydrolase protein [Boeremia exigua]KAH6639563.1 Alpha/Beta hydrolase protein [Boeremia exigua]